MKRMLFLLTTVGLSLAFLTGCVHMPGGIAPSTTPLEGRDYTVLRRTAATDSRVALLGIIPLTGANTIREAIDAAAMKAGGEALIDVTVEGYSQWWILFTRHVTRVEGVAIRFNK